MKSHLYELKNLELKGQLKQFLKQARKEKKSYRTIALELSASGTTVGRTAVGDWCNQLENKKER